jgi:colanic acid/amylovoran biosynthesis glycosyltransferase
MTSPKKHPRTYPFAVISPNLGKISETFIHRHISELLPGRTAVIAREKDPHLNQRELNFPYIILKKSRYNLSWFYRGIRYFLKFNEFTPVQVTVEKYLRRHHVRIILSEYLDESIKWMNVAQKLGIKFYTHAHGYDVSKMLRDPGMCKQYLKLQKADGIITVSEHSKKKLTGLGLQEGKIQVIPCGIDVPANPLIRQPEDIIKCLAVGRMVPKKAPLLMLKSFQLAFTKNPKLRLDYIGDGELFKAASRFVQEQSLNSIVTLHGSQSNSIVQELMKKADIFIQHSITDPVTGDEEGLPVAILEAMANSLPVVSTRHAGIPEAVNEGDTGYLVDEGDILQMAVPILKLADNISIRNKMGIAGWERATKYFSWKLEKRRLLELLKL